MKNYLLMFCFLIGGCKSADADNISNVAAGEYCILDSECQDNLTCKNYTCQSKIPILPWKQALPEEREARMLETSMCILRRYTDCLFQIDNVYMCKSIFATMACDKNARESCHPIVDGQPAGTMYIPSCSDSN
jgi:hypothetical protein